MIDETNAGESRRACSGVCAANVMKLQIMTFSHFPHAWLSVEMKRERENLWFIVCHVTQKRRLNKFVPHFYLLQWLLCDVSTPMHTCMDFESSFHDHRCALWSCPQNSSLRRMRGLRLMASLSNWMHFRKRERIFKAKSWKKLAKETFWNEW